MHSSLKLIKIKGYLKSLDNYTEDSGRGIRVYKTVSIVDEDGDEVYFDTLFITVRNDKEVRNGELLTFYILRLKQNGRMAGAIVAVDHGTEKRYYKLEANTAMRTLARASGTRGSLMASLGPQAYTFLSVLALIPGGVLAIYLSTIVGRDMAMILFYLMLAATTYWMIAPIFNSKSSGISEAEEMLKSDGFNLAGTVKAKPTGYDKY